MNRPTIVLAEDHPNVAEQLHKLLADSFDVVAVVSHGEALVKTALRVKPDVVVTDISMPGMDGLKAAQEILLHQPTLGVVFVTVHDDPALARKALTIGLGYVLKASAGVDALHVPYKGSNPATAAILGGEVTFVFSTMPPAISNAKAGKLRALAVTTAARVAPAPEVPTMVEAGVPNFEIVLYSGILGPKGMDAALVRKLNAEFAKVVQAPEIKNVYENIGADPLAMSPQEFQKRTVDEIAKFGPVVKASGAKVD